MEDKRVFPTHIVAVAGVVENGKGEVLLVKLKKGEWVYPGGQVEAGENLIDALIREIWEESGIHARIEKLFWIGSNTAEHKGYNGIDVVPTKVVIDFICSFEGGELRESDETVEARWVAKDKVLDMLQSPMRERYEAYLGFDGTVQYMEFVTRPFELIMKRNV